MRCHRAGTAAPMVLDTYEQVRAFAPLIKQSVQTRTMPPGWYIDRTVGIQAFKNDPSLSEQEIETIARWVDSVRRRATWRTYRCRVIGSQTTSIGSSSRTEVGGHRTLSSRRHRLRFLPIAAISGGSRTQS